MSEVKLVVVYNDCAKPVTFKRSDTNEPTSCVDCSAFTSEGACMMQHVRSCWPLGTVACSQWSLRTVPHEEVPCRGCRMPLVKYLRDRLCRSCGMRARWDSAFRDKMLNP